MYKVRNKGDDKTVFTTDVQLQAEMVAIALGLSSLYGTPQVYEIKKGFRVINTITTDTAFAAMQVKMRNLIFNRKVTRRMPFSPDAFTHFSHTKIIEAIQKDKSLDDVKKRLYDEVDEYVSYARESLIQR